MAYMEIKPIKPAVLPLSPVTVNLPKVIKNLNNRFPYSQPSRQTATKNHKSDTNRRDSVTIGEIRDQARKVYECISFPPVGMIPTKVENATQREKAAIDQIAMWARWLAMPTMKTETHEKITEYSRRSAKKLRFAR